MADRDLWDLRGPVRACRIQRAWYTRRCGTEACETAEGGDVSAVEFRTDGSLTQSWHRNPDGSEWTSTYEYNDRGRLTEVRMGNEGGVDNLRSYSYDSLERLTRVTDRTQGGGERISESYEYDDACCKRKTNYDDATVQRPNTLRGWAVEGTDTMYAAAGATMMTTLYNDRGQPTGLILYNGAGNPLSRVEFRYDHNGNLVEEAQTNAEAMLPPGVPTSMNPARLETVRRLLGVGGEPIRRTHRYNDEGRRIATRQRIVPFGEDRKTMAYNDRGDRAEEVSEHEQREFTLDEEGRLTAIPSKASVSRSEARFRYEYDAHGNWVMKTVGCRYGADQDYTVTSVERRTLDYFE